MANYFDQFDPQQQPQATGNYFDQFDAPAQQAPTINKLGAAAFPDFLRQELANTNWATRNLAGAGTALSNLYEGAKQLIGQGDPQQIEANKIIAQEAPVGSVVGNAALSAIPFGMVGNSVKGAAAVGAGLGLLQPVSGDQSATNVAEGKLKSAAVGGVLAAGGQALANKVGDLITQKAADLALQKQQAAPLVQTINDAQDAGIVVPPTSVNPTFANGLKESIAGKAATAQVASNRNAPVFDSLARKALYLPDNAPLDSITMQNARDLAYQAGYKPVLDMPYINWDQKFLSDLKGISPASQGGAVQSPAQGSIDDLLGSLDAKGTWTGPQLVSDIRNLRNQANANFRAASMPGGNNGAQELAHAQQAAADALEGLAQRNITMQGGSPDALALMQQARQYIAKSHDIEDAIVEGGGSINPGVLASKLQKGRPLTDELSVIGRFANNFPQASQPAKKIGSPAVSALRAAMATPTALAATIAGHPLAGLATAATQVAAPAAMRSYLLSGGSQNALRDIYQLGLPTLMANRLLQYTPVGGTVLGLQALGQ